MEGRKGGREGGGGGGGEIQNESWIQEEKTKEKSDETEVHNMIQLEI